MYLSVVFLVVETPRYRTAIDPFIVLLAALALDALWKGTAEARAIVELSRLSREINRRSRDVTPQRWRPSGPMSHSPSSCGSASHDSASSRPRAISACANSGAKNR